VLVVDDQEDTRELMAFVLERAGAKVTLAESASLALSALAETDFGVLISDIGMPQQDGYDLIRRLRTCDGSPTSRHIPAVAITAFGSPEDRKKALAAGFQEHLPKPVDPAKLVDVVARLAAPNMVRVHA
jgi:CheY-like chemotaxis protein